MSNKLHERTIDALTRAKMDGYREGVSEFAGFLVNSFTESFDEMRADGEWPHNMRSVVALIPKLEAIFLESPGE